MDYGNNILVPFDMIYDIDLGLFKLIKEYKKNPKMFNQAMLNITDNNFKNIILNAETYDPLLEIVSDDYKNRSKDILYTIMDLEDGDYVNLIKLASPTDILGLIAVFLKSSLVKVTILCRDVSEPLKIKLNKLLDEVSFIVEPDYSKVNVEAFDSIFIKDYKKTLKIKKLQGKSLFIGNYKFNQEKESPVDNKIIPLKDVSMLVGDTNRLYFIDMYKTDNSYPIYG